MLWHRNRNVVQVTVTTRVSSDPRSPNDAHQQFTWLVKHREALREQLEMCGVPGTYLPHSPSTGSPLPAFLGLYSWPHSLPSSAPRVDQMFQE